uniref:Ssu-2 homolog n=1 Tax=Falco tinnunculus TaxID=100819 RepID=A0A8C4UE91_FALTI
PLYQPPIVPPVTEAVARQALLSFMASQCCYGSREAEELAVQWLWQLGTYLVSTLQPGALGTSSERCHGHGRSKCGVYHGAGWVRNPFCCMQRCNTCSGWGSKTCTTCQGGKKLQHFKQLVITWKNNIFEFVSEHHLNFPGELLSKVSGENIFKDENVVVYPTIDFPEPKISLASQRAIAEHSAAFSMSSRIRRQVKGSSEQGHPHVPPACCAPLSWGGQRTID